MIDFSQSGHAQTREVLVQDEGWEKAHVMGVGTWIGNKEGKLSRQKAGDKGRQ